MLDKEEDPEKIVIQFKAANRGLDIAYKVLLDEVLRLSLASKIVEVALLCPGNCGNEEKIEFIRTQFPKFKLDELVDRLKEITAIGDGVIAHNLKKK